MKKGADFWKNVKYMYEMGMDELEISEYFDTTVEELRKDISESIKEDNKNASNPAKLSDPR